MIEYLFSWVCMSFSLLLHLWRLGLCSKCHSSGGSQSWSSATFSDESQLTNCSFCNLPSCCWIFTKLWIYLGTLYGSVLGTLSSEGSGIKNVSQRQRCSILQIYWTVGHSVSCLFLLMLIEYSTEGVRQGVWTQLCYRLWPAPPRIESTSSLNLLFFWWSLGWLKISSSEVPEPSPDSIPFWSLSLGPLQTASFLFWTIQRSASAPPSFPLTLHTAPGRLLKTQVFLLHQEPWCGLRVSQCSQHH